MHTKFSTQFNRTYRKLAIFDQLAIDAAIELFKEDPFHPDLNSENGCFLATA